MTYLLIVDTAHPRVFEQLTSLFADNPEVRVIWDRRFVSDLRGRSAEERRGRPSPSWSDVHFTLAIDAQT